MKTMIKFQKGFKSTNTMGKFKSDTDLWFGMEVGIVWRVKIFFMNHCLHDIHYNWNPPWGLKHSRRVSFFSGRVLEIASVTVGCIVIITYLNLGWHNLITVKIWIFLSDQDEGRIDQFKIRSYFIKTLNHNHDEGRFYCRLKVISYTNMHIYIWIYHAQNF